MTVGRAVLVDAGAAGAFVSEVRGAALSWTGCGTGPTERTASPVDGRRGTATSAITSTATAESAATCVRFGCHGAAGAAATLRELDSAAGAVDETGSVGAVADVGAGGALVRFFAGVRFFTGFFARARASPSTSADTSNVQRTLRPDRPGESLICCFFATQRHRATHVPSDSPEGFGGLPEE